MAPYEERQRNPPEQTTMRELFVYLKTRIAVEFSDEAINALGPGLIGDGPSYKYVTRRLQLGPDHEWKDGFVLWVRAPMDAKDFADKEAEMLGHFDTWAVLDHKGNFAESFHGGPVSRFFDAQQTAELGRYAQIFMLWDENSRWREKTVDSIRSALKGELMPVFFFRNGQIMLLGSGESGRITNQRCRSLLSGLRAWRIRDSSGETFSPNGLDDGAWDGHAFLQIGSRLLNPNT